MKPMKLSLRTIRTVISAAIAVFTLFQVSVPSATMRAQPQAARTLYTCPMDPEVRSKDAGKCPKCGMNLRPADESDLPPVTDNRPATATRPDGSIEGLNIPDVLVVDQDGRRLRFFTDLVKGRTVAINFMFTTCTTICPPLAVTFARVQQQLSPSMGNEVLLISVSVDPVTDVPPRMKAYLSKFGARPGWVFIGGAKAEINTLLRALGAYVSDKNDHTPMILIGNAATGYWTRAFGLAPASKLASLITEAAQKPVSKAVVR
jgi:protein SCO1/2